MKVKHGKSQEITDQLSKHAATAFAQWIGCAIVIYNQKTVQSTNDYVAWLAASPTTKLIVNQQVAYLCELLPFLKKNEKGARTRVFRMRRLCKTCSYRCNDQ